MRPHQTSISLFLFKFPARWSNEKWILNELKYSKNETDSFVIESHPVNEKTRLYVGEGCLVGSKVGWRWNNAKWPLTQGHVLSSVYFLDHGVCLYPLDTPLLDDVAAEKYSCVAPK